MSILSIDIINHLQEKDKEKISYFAKLLLKKKEYNNLAKEISDRRDEINRNETISHKKFWNDLDV